MTVRSSFIERREKQFLGEQLHSRGNRHRNQRSDNPQPRRAQKDGDDGDTRGYLHGPADDFGCQQIILTQPERDVEHESGNADRDGNGQRDSGDDEPADVEA